LHLLSPKIQAKTSSLFLAIPGSNSHGPIIEGPQRNRTASFYRKSHWYCKLSRSKNTRDAHRIALLDFSERFLVALWSPLAKNSPKTSTGFRVYLKNVLRRSHTTYNTLIATFYYLALLQLTIKQKFPTKPFQVSQELQPLQCQRRVLLAALMLGWKFTQDYGYSTRRWASFSGLRGKELNRNEVLFFSVIDWRLFISHVMFSHWKTEVLYYVQNPDVALPEFPSTQWQSIY
jgi:hypothetical protein